MGSRHQSNKLDLQSHVNFELREEIATLEARLVKYAGDCERIERAVLLLNEVYETVPLRDLIDDATFSEIEEILATEGLIRT